MRQLLKQDLAWVVRQEIDSFHLSQMSKPGFTLLKGSVITSKKGEVWVAEYQQQPHWISPYRFAVVGLTGLFECTWTRGGGAFDGSGATFHSHVWGPYSMETLSRGLWYVTGNVGPRENHLSLFRAGMWQRADLEDRERSDLLRSELLPAILGRELLTVIEGRFVIAPRVTPEEATEEEAENA
jgi:hypothetical protein